MRTKEHLKFTLILLGSRNGDFCLLNTITAPTTLYNVSARQQIQINNFLQF